jgi:galactose-1-phosphate uridylyltransferase
MNGGYGGGKNHNGGARHSKKMNGGYGGGKNHRGGGGEIYNFFQIFEKIPSKFKNKIYYMKQHDVTKNYYFVNPFNSPNVEIVIDQIRPTKDTSAVLYCFKGESNYTSIDLLFAEFVGKQCSEAKGIETSIPEPYLGGLKKTMDYLKGNNHKFTFSYDNVHSKLLNIRFGSN